MGHDYTVIIAAVILLHISFGGINIVLLQAVSDRRRHSHVSGIFTTLDPYEIY